jgi:hypothetical protein
MAPMEMILPLMTTMAMKAARGDTRATLVWRENYICALVRLTPMDLRTQHRGEKVSDARWAENKGEERQGREVGTGTGGEGDKQKTDAEDRQRSASPNQGVEPDHGKCRRRAAANGGQARLRQGSSWWTIVRMKAAATHTYTQSPT